MRHITEIISKTPERSATFPDGSAILFSWRCNCGQRGAVWYTDRNRAARQAAKHTDTENS